MASIQKIETLHIDLIEDLWCQLKQHHQDRTVDFTDYYLQSSFEKRKSELLAKDELAIFVAQEGELAIGFCVVSINAKQGEVDSLFVTQSHRGLNLGAQLLQAGIAWLNQQDVSSVRLLVGQGNEYALAFYQKFGFKVRATMMEYFG